MTYFYDDKEPSIAPGYVPPPEDPNFPDLYAVIPEYGGKYWACTDGNVFKERGAAEPKKISQFMGNGGYRMVALQGRPIVLARLILGIFRGTPKAKRNVRYIKDDNYKMCHLRNLEWRNPMSTVTKEMFTEIKEHVGMGYTVQEVSKRLLLKAQDVREALLLDQQGILEFGEPEHKVNVYDRVHGQLLGSSVRAVWGEQAFNRASASTPIEAIEGRALMCTELNFGIMLDAAEQAGRIGYYRLFEALLEQHRRLLKEYPDLEAEQSYYSSKLINNHRNAWFDTYWAYKNGKPLEAANILGVTWGDDGNDRGTATSY
jgi:hypothetical protein